MLQTTDRIGRLKHALEWRGRGSRFVYWFLLVLGSFAVVYLVSDLAENPEYPLGDLGAIALYLALVSKEAGLLLYARKRTLAGLLWVATLLVFAPLGTVLLTVFWSSLRGTSVALLFLILMLITYGVVLWGYLSAGEDDARQG